MKVKVLGLTKSNWIEALTTEYIEILCKSKRKDVRAFIGKTLNLWIDADEFRVIKRKIRKTLRAKKYDDNRD